MGKSRISALSSAPTKTLQCMVIAFGVKLVITLASCGHKPTCDPSGSYWIDDDRRNIAEPESRDPSLIWTSINRTAFDQALELVNVERSIGKLTGKPGQATNINSFDEVPNSSWFTNRHGLVRMTPGEIAAGYCTTGGPDTTGPWFVFRPKVGGATPGFWIEDARGHQYIIKFDPIDSPELATAAAAMGSRYFHACGYNVPQETIVYWRPENLRIREGATIRDRSGVKRPLTENDLQDILEGVNCNPDGRIRSVASLSLGESGTIKGPFSYSGKRNDDPNDWYRHENRRELRGLYVIASLVNHYDTKDHNSLDVYEEENGNRFLRHYLIDFGSTFGSDGDGPKTPKKGYANVFDLRDVLVSLVTLGLKTWPWEHATRPQYPSVGYFESEIFEPGKFDCIVPNPAFENMTDRDAYWGAKIVMAFRDDDLRSLVRAGRYSDPEAEAFVLKTLIERRDKIGRHWFGKVNPLDNFSAESREGELRISFEDLAVRYGLEPDEAVYKYRVYFKGRDTFGERESRQCRITFSKEDIERMVSQHDLRPAGDGTEVCLYEVEIRTKRSSAKLSKPTEIWLRYDPPEGDFRLVAIEHVD